ncbi:MAG: alcohol dehydrogenase catalytic domain-containing protein [Dermatophilaceae bacterium]
MKALILEDYKQFNYTTAPDPTPGPDDVLIAVKACGICGSDVHGMDGSTGRRRPPIIMGHEAAGTDRGGGRPCAGLAQRRPGDLRLDGLLWDVFLLSTWSD